MISLGVTGVRTAVAAGLVAASLTLAGGTSSAAVGRGPSGVVPAPGARYVPAGTSIVFRRLSPAVLHGLTVMGSATGRHAGTLESVAGGGSEFVPDHPFAGGEVVTVNAPEAELSYSFTTARSPAPEEAAAALRVAQSYDPLNASPTPAPGSRRPGSVRAGAAATPVSCPATAYHTAPTYPSVCMNVGVTTSGTEPGTYLFLTPNLQAGIWTDTGQLVWYGPGGANDESVVQYQGQSYLALWAGGQVYLYDNHYQLAGVVTAGSGFAPNQIDAHEFQITPAGDALVGIYDPVTVPTSGGGQETVVQYVVQELSLVHDSTGIHTGSLLFEWSSLTDVPTSQSKIPDPGSGGVWDYFHGNAITQDTDGNLLVSARHTWGIYKIDANPADPSFGHVMWQVGATGDHQLAQPWCYQHDIVPLGNNAYSLYDDGGSGPGCLQGSTDHPARGLIITVNPSTVPAGVTLDQAYTHDPPIFTQFTGSTQVLPDGNVLVGWANFPQTTEFSTSHSVLMDLSLTSFSYRAYRFAWDGEPLQPPAVAAAPGPGATTVWASWNGSTETVAWRVLGGPDAAHLATVGGPYAKTGFETSMVVPGHYPAVAVQALNSAGAVLATSNVHNSYGDLVASSGGGVASGGTFPLAGSVAGARLAAPVVGMAAVPGGGGYWLVAADGGVFTFGSAGFYGSAAGFHLRSPVVGMAGVPGGGGYWMVASDGGVFAFGSAGFAGSAGQLHLAAPIVGMAAVPGGSGYWLVGQDGGVFSYGGAGFFGAAAPSKLGSPVVGVAAVPVPGDGYWLATANGTTEAFQEVGPYLSQPGAGLPGPVVAIASASLGSG